MFDKDLFPCFQIPSWFKAEPSEEVDMSLLALGGTLVDAINRFGGSSPLNVLVQMIDRWLTATATATT